MGQCPYYVYDDNENEYKHNCNWLHFEKQGKITYEKVFSNDYCRGKNYFWLSQKQKDEYTGYKECPVYKAEEFSSGCFLSSACTPYEGLPDNCQLLTALRGYRDNYLAQRVEGEQLIREYYHIEPQIVSQINASSKKVEYFQYIYQTIQNCVALIDKQQYEQVKQVYMYMVNHLKMELLPTR